MPRRQKLKFSHTQSDGIFFGEEVRPGKVYPSEMFGMFRNRNYMGKRQLMRKEKRGSWTLPIPTIITRVRKRK